jgi:hypothetical protein
MLLEQKFLEQIFLQQLLLKQTLQKERNFIIIKLISFFFRISLLEEKVARTNVIRTKSALPS